MEYSLPANAQFVSERTFDLELDFPGGYKSLELLYKTDDEDFPSESNFKFSIFKVYGDDIKFTITGMSQLSDPDYEYSNGFYYREFELDLKFPVNNTDSELNSQYKIFYTIMRGKQEYASGEFTLYITQFCKNDAKGNISPSSTTIKSGESFRLNLDVLSSGSLQWEERTPDESEWTYIANGRTLTRTLTNTGINDIYYTYRVVNKIGGEEIVSNSASVLVKPAPNPGTITPLNQNSDAFSLLPLLHYNAIEASSLQWQKLVGSNWSDIAGENREYFNHPTGSTDGTYQYRVKVTASSGVILYTPVATINYTTNGSAISDFFGGTISPALQNVNTGSATVTLTVSGITGGGTSGISYQWQKSTDGILYDNINGAANTTYSPGILSINTYFRVAVVCNGKTAYSQAGLVEIASNSGISFSLSNNENSIVKRISRIAESAISDNAVNEMINVTYFDGLGRPVQTIQHGISPSFKDLVILQEYDGLGRESNTWLPALISGNNGAYVNPATIKTNAVISNGNDRKPYSMPEYEAAPLNRTIKQYGPGADWQNNSKAVKTAYRSNLAGDATLNCVLYKAGGTNQAPTLTTNNNYTTGALYVTKVADEDGNTSYEFKDKLGQVVLTRQIENNVNHDTYYVYNDFGLQCYVLPPKIQDEGITQAKLDELAYQYKYDHRNRCIAKKLPGCDWIYYVYDKADRLIFTQDGEQYNKSPREWTFTIPDVFGRIVLTGVCKDTISVSNKVVKGVFSTTGSYKSYSIHVDGTAKTFVSTPVILSANYYDNYDFLGYNGIPNTADTQYTTESGYGTWYGTDYTEANKYKNKGMLTGTLTAQMNPDGTIAPTYLYSVMYYDDRARLIQTKGNNHLAGTEKEYIAYNFLGQPVKRKHVHQVPGKNTQYEIYAYSYDHAGRLLKTIHQLLDGTTVKPVTTLAENTYDELGRLKTNKKGGNDNLNTTYAYNIRSWTNSIVNAHFNETLAYTYNGNISRMQWGQAGKTRTYNFSYDNLSRLKAATYTGDGNFNTAYSYDKHGNMLTLQRYGLTAAATYGMIDNLTMNYTGNQMKAVSDAAADIALNTSMDFKNYSNATTEYTYNKNGAMTQDLNKGISQIQYNSLNLPQIVDIKNKTTEGRNEYTYSASGQKLKAVQKWNPNYSTTPVIGSTINTAALTQSQTTDYVGNIIYENNALKRILVDGGYYESGNYYFYINDHLGNNRIVADAAASIVQSTQYYPFGTSFADASGTSTQPYKYNGKELDARNGLNMYDYSARWKDDFRFTTVDPMAEMSYSWSPYVYVENNPIKFTDPTGMRKYGDDEVNAELDRKDRIRGYSIIGSSVTPPTDIVSVDGVVVEHINDGKTDAIHLSARDVDVWGTFGGVVGFGMDVTSVYSDLFHDHFNYKASDGLIKSLYKGPNSLKPRSLLAKDYIRWSKTLKGIGHLSNGTMIVTGTYNIVNGSTNPLDYTDTAAGLATIIESAVLKFTNAPSSKVPVVGEVVAIYGGLRLSMDVGRFLGVRFGGDAWVRWYREYQNEKEQEAMINRWKQYK
jgi:RHS repeat-associated protein